jgi:hypothetical protein
MNQISCSRISPFSNNHCLALSIFGVCAPRQETTLMLYGSLENMSLPLHLIKMEMFRVLALAWE